MNAHPAPLDQARLKFQTTKNKPNVLRPRMSPEERMARRRQVKKRKRFKNKLTEMRELGPPLFVQLLNTRSMSHILWQALPQMVSKDIQVICLRQVKMALLARSCVCPGSLALITNLLSSFEPPSTILPKNRRFGKAAKRR